MPYIEEWDRDVAEIDPTNAGQLTYCLYSKCIYYLGGKSMRYQDIADVLGALEATKLEIYRRIVAPYEDQKLNENGDV